MAQHRPHRFDERNVRTMHLIETSVEGPIAQPYINALPGDSIIPTYQIHVFDAESGEGVASDAKMDPNAPFSNDSVILAESSTPSFRTAELV